MSKLTEAEKILELHLGSEFYRLQESEFYRNIKNAMNEAINYKPCCESDSEQLVCAVDYLPNLTKGKKYTCKPDGLIFFEVKDDFGIAYKIHKRCFKNEVIAN